MPFAIVTDATVRDLFNAIMTHAADIKLETKENYDVYNGFRVILLSKYVPFNPFMIQKSHLVQFTKPVDTPMMTLMPVDFYIYIMFRAPGQPKSLGWYFPDASGRPIAPNN